MEFKTIISTIGSIYLLAQGLPDVLIKFGISIPKVLNFIPTIIDYLIVLLCIIWLVIDGMNEDHFMKYLSLGVAVLIATIFTADILRRIGWFSIPLPGFIIAQTGWLYVAGAMLLILGLWTNG